MREEEMVSSSFFLFLSSFFLFLVSSFFLSSFSFFLSSFFFLLSFFLLFLSFFFLSSFFSPLLLLSFFLSSFFFLQMISFIHSFIQIFLDFSSVRGDYIDHSRQHHQICIFLGVLISNSTLPIIFFQQKKHILNKFSIKLNRNVLFNFLMGFQSLL